MTENWNRHEIRPKTTEKYRLTVRFGVADWNWNVRTNKMKTGKNCVDNGKNWKDAGLLGAQQSIGCGKNSALMAAAGGCTRSMRFICHYSIRIFFWLIPFMFSHWPKNRVSTIFSLVRCVLFASPSSLALVTRQLWPTVLVRRQHWPRSVSLIAFEFNDLWNCHFFSVAQQTQRMLVLMASSSSTCLCNCDSFFASFFRLSHHVVSESMQFRAASGSIQSIVKWISRES